jgi:FixJ family two-component response regulator
MSARIERGGNSAAPTVLVVDDDPAVRNSLKFMLTIEGFQVRSYHDGAELLQDSLPPMDACLVIDQILPGMSGLDAVDAVRRRISSLPAILITTHLTDALSRRAASLKVTIITKPLLDDVLLQAIRVALRLPAGGC